MKHFKHHSLAILPLLAVLAISPSDLKKVSEGRSIASIETETQSKSETPRLDAVVGKLDRAAILKNERVSVEKFMTDLNELQKRVELEHGEFKQPLDVKAAVQEQRQQIESHIIKVVIAESNLRVLQKKKLLVPEVEAEILEQLTKTKGNLESLLTCLEGNEKLVADAEGAEEVGPKEDVIADNDPKAEEPKQDEEPKEDVIADSEPKEEEEPQKEEEPKAEVAKEDEECKDDKYDALTKQIELLVTQQNDILKTMLNMSNTMMSMMQQQQQNQWNPYMHGPLVPYAHMYQYGSSNSNGAWVYMPNGFNPSQLGPGMGGMGGFYPDQLQPQPNSWMQPQQPAAPAWNGWGLSNQYQFQPDERYQVTGQLIGGNFGYGMENFGFNMGAPLTAHL